MQAVRELGDRRIQDALDGRSRATKALRSWRDALIQDLGGVDVLSAQQLTVLEQAARAKVMLDAIDSWLFEDGSRTVNKSKRTLTPIVLQRQKLADALVRYVTTLGLERKAKAVYLEEYVSENYGEDAE
jgi:hypothetical protein